MSVLVTAGRSQERPAFLPTNERWVEARKRALLRSSELTAFQTTNERPSQAGIGPLVRSLERQAFRGARTT